LLLTLPALPAACHRHAELGTPELADLRKATRTDGAGISRAESALGSLTPPERRSRYVMIAGRGRPAISADMDADPVV